MFGKSEEKKLDKLKHLVGTNFHEWILEKSLGHGDTATVFRGKNSESGEIVAVKIFYPDTLVEHGSDIERERISWQLGLVGRASHPNLIKILGGNLGVAPGEDTFLIMEYVPGKTLDRLLKDIVPSEYGFIIRSIAQAAIYLESLGFTHRDIKPANVILSPDHSQVTVLDLGILRRIPNGDGGGRLSGSRFVSTARYSPPEFVWRRESDNIEAWRAISFYQIGAVLHDLLTKRRLFDEYEQAQLYDAIKGTTPQIEAQGAPTRLISLAQRALLKSPDARLKCLTWDDFTNDMSLTASLRAQMTELRGIQAVVSEQRRLEDEKKESMLQPTNASTIWSLSKMLVVLIPEFLRSSEIFPLFSCVESVSGEKGRTVLLVFEADPNRKLPNTMKLSATLESSIEHPELIECRVAGIVESRLVNERKFETIAEAGGIAGLLEEDLLVLLKFGMGV